MKDKIAELRQLVADLKENNRRLRYTDDDTVAELQDQNVEKKDTGITDRTRRK